MLKTYIVRLYKTKTKKIPQHAFHKRQQRKTEAKSWKKFYQVNTNPKKYDIAMLMFT